MPPRRKKPPAHAPPPAGEEHRYATQRYWAARYAAVGDGDVFEWFLSFDDLRPLLGFVKRRSSVLDLGCGSAVFLLDLAAGREGRFLGIDYSEVAVALAANVGQKRGLSQVRFCHADATRLEDLEERFGLVLDKGTFDAYMLGAAASVDRYAASVLAALKPGGVFVITTCNSTADEVAALFTARGFVERDRVPYPTFEFGGRKGAAVATVALVAGDG